MRSIEISKVDNYTWIFTSRIFRLALEITFLHQKYFFLQMAYESLSQSRKLNQQEGPNKGGGGGRGGGMMEKFLKRNKRGGRLLGTRE